MFYDMIKAEKSVMESTQRSYNESVESKGIALLIDKQFPNARLLRQGLGRVGRYGEACKRFHLAEMVNLIDHKERLRLIGKLSSRM